MRGLPPGIDRGMATASATAALARIRKLCLSFPDTSERTSHGGPTFFIRKKNAFLMFLDNHHGDGRLAIWCACPAEVRPMLIDSAQQDEYFLPPYVARIGWVGIRLDRKLPWGQIASLIEQAFLTRMASLPVPRRRLKPG
jgi:predicted DNA-binding protein (MmcQ/YjbR family)